MPLPLQEAQGHELGHDAPDWLIDPEAFANVASSANELLTVGSLKVGREIRLWRVKPQSGPGVALMFATTDDHAACNVARAAWAAGGEGPTFTFRKR